MIYRPDHVRSMARLFAAQAALSGPEVAMEVVLMRHDETRGRSERPSGTGVPRAVTDEIIAGVASRHGVPVSCIKGPAMGATADGRWKHRTSAVSAARFEACWRIAKVVECWSETARRVGIHHTSVINACRRFEARNPDVVRAEGALRDFGEERAA